MTAWVTSRRVLVRRLPDCILALSLDGGDPTVLEGTGAELWDLLGRPRTLDDLADVLAERHGADPALVRADLAPALDDLGRRGLVEAIES